MNPERSWEGGREPSLSSLDVEVVEFCRGPHRRISKVPVSKQPHESHIYTYKRCEIFNASIRC
jgi:hypothetical protein